MKVTLTLKLDELHLRDAIASSRCKIKDDRKFKAYIKTPAFAKALADDIANVWIEVNERAEGEYDDFIFALFKDVVTDPYEDAEEDLK